MAESWKKLWLIDGAYLFNARQYVSPNYHYDYLKLRRKIEESGPIWRADYLNSTPDPSRDEQDSFHTWLISGPPRGPKIITKLYPLRDVAADRAYCELCAAKVRLTCPDGARTTASSTSSRKEWIWESRPWP